MTALILALLLAAQPEWVERFERLTPEQRQRLLERMPPARRAEFQRRLERWRATSPEERERLGRDLGAMRQLTPREREHFRETLKEIADLPAERRRAVRGAIQTLRGMRPERRAEMLASERFARRFAEADQRLIREALSVLP